MNDQEKNMIMSSMVSINCFKHFSVMRTMNKIESSQYICRMLYKFSKENYCNNENSDVIDFSDIENKEHISSKLHMSGLKNEKNHEINSETINLCMLCQVPGINEKLQMLSLSITRI